MLVLLRAVPPRRDDRLDAAHPRLAPARTGLDDHPDDHLLHVLRLGRGASTTTPPTRRRTRWKIFVIGKQWMWKAQYPDGQRVIIGGNPRNMTEAERQSIGAARASRSTGRSRSRMTSEDVIHDFGVPAFRSKIDVLPGRYTPGVVSPDQDSASTTSSATSTAGRGTR